MSRFNTRGHQAKPAVATVSSVLGTVSRKVADALTFEGGRGWTKDPKTDLFLRASASFHDGSDRFYESGYQRDETLRQLARQIAVEDFDWFANFVKWLRRTANIRTAALMIAADGVKARLDAGLQAPGSSVMPTNREVIDSVLYRADEPGELLAYWMAQYGRAIPKPVKRGVGDAARRLYSQKSLLKYDTESHGVRFGDVLNLAHVVPAERIIIVREVETGETVFAECPTPKKKRFAVAESIPSVARDGTPLYAYACRCGWYHSSSRAPAPWDSNEFVEVPVVRHERVPFSPQGDLFRFALDRRYGNVNGVPESLDVIRKNALLRSEGDPSDWLDPEILYQAGMTWEDALSAVGSKVDKAKLWEAMIPSMGYMALLRNLRNFDEAGVSNRVADQVIAKLADPEEVAKSRQLPFRFYSAYKNAPSLRWGHALETALDLCLSNVPVLSGRTLVLTDTSGSMGAYMSGKSTIMCLEAAGLFASAIARRNAGSVDLFQYANYAASLDVPKGGSVLRMVEAVRQNSNRVGMGTNIEGSVRATYKGHDRVIIFSDGQGTWGKSAQGVGGSVPANIPVYLFNIEGYSVSPMPTGSAARFDLGGLSDQTFKLIPLLEAGRDGAWPWETDS